MYTKIHIKHFKVWTDLMSQLLVELVDTLFTAVYLNATGKATYTTHKKDGSVCHRRKPQSVSLDCNSLGSFVQDRNQEALNKQTVGGARAT